MHTFFARILRSTSMPRDVLLTLVGAALGLAISHLYYMKSTSDMRGDVEERKRVDELILRGIENVGSMKYIHDDSGKVIGVKIQLRGSGQAQASGAATLTIASPNETK